ncbi:MAG: mycofactocin-associated electron transfer flavoprotein beta subunit [Acidimicrobiales bacterium]|jgi:electron transfer flavoprotein beta subunit
MSVAGLAGSGAPEAPHAGMAAGPAARQQRAPGPVIVACMKLVELRAGVDALSGAVLADPASAGPSPSDEAALEWALRIAEATGGHVVVMSAGGPRCDEMLRAAVAAGADRAVRLQLSATAPSAVVAATLAAGVRSVVAAPAHLPAGVAGGSDAAEAVLPAGVVVCCGDASADRGSGSVPAFLAGELAAAQALGLVAVVVPPPSQSPAGVVLEVERRLERGRRERLRLRAPCVVSVEAVTARLRRAPLARALAAGAADVEVLGGAAGSLGGPLAEPTSGHVELVALEPFRPRTRLVPPPAPGLAARDRILGLTGALHERPAARTLVLEPEQAADELLSTLAQWGELPQPPLPDTEGDDETEGQ